jgi:site-specific recombinase XerD
MFLIKRESGIYYLVYKEANNIYRKISTRTKKKSEAVTVLKRYNDKLILENKRRYFNMVALQKFVMDYNQTNLSSTTCNLYKRAFKEFIKKIGNRIVSDITSEDIERFKSKRLKDVSAVTINIELRCLKSAFNVALRFGFLKTNPFIYVKQFKEIENEKMVFTTNEVERLLSVIDIPLINNFISIGMYTGLRLGEILNLQWKDIQFSERIIKVLNKEYYTIKTGKLRTIPISDKLFTILINMKAVKECQHDEYLFQSYNGKPFNKSFITRKFKNFINKAGLPEHLHFHNIRHTFITELLKRGVSIYKVKLLAGHSNIKTTEGYAHMVVDDLRSAVELI